MTVPTVIRVDPFSPDADAIARAAELLRRGGLVVFPTETVYGLGANALNPAAIARVYEAKGRPSRNPLIVHVDSVSQAASLTRRWTPLAQKLVDQFWPGPLTIVLPRSRVVPLGATGGGDTVAIRWPAHPVARALIAAAGVPVAAPSANRSTELSPTTADHVLSGLRDGFDLLLDGGATTGGLESTVMDMTSDPPRLLRPGLISPAEIAECVGPIERVVAPDRGEGPAMSPGTMSRHYAPHAPLHCVGDEAAARELVAELASQGRRVGWMRWDNGGGSPTPGVIEIEMPRDVPRYALRFYADLHDLDAAEVDVIVATLPPEEDGWLAVRDRLRRAAAGR